MKKQILNEDRTRYYGVRVGDLVSDSITVGNTNMTVKKIGEVVELGASDNKTVYVQWEGSKKPRKEVAEWLTIEEKIEDRIVYH